MQIISNDYSFLFEAFAVDFGDNYHRMNSDISFELERDARKIRRRYRNLTEYMRALDTYNLYMSYLSMKHGGKELFKIKLKNELVEDFVPPKPRMKNTEFNKYLLKHKIILSNTKSSEPNEKHLKTVEEILSIGLYGTEIIGTEPKDKLAMKLIKEEQNCLSEKQLKEIDNIDYLEEYFQNKNIKTKEDREKEEVRGIQQFIDGSFIDKIKSTKEEDDVVFYSGRFMSRDTVDELGFYQDLGKLGWEPLKIMKSKNVNKKITNIIKEKEKQGKKKNKKNRKKDDFLIKIVTDNDFDTYEDFEKDMLDFTSSNIFD